MDNLPALWIFGRKNNGKQSDGLYESQATGCIRLLYRGGCVVKQAYSFADRHNIRYRGLPGRMLMALLVFILHVIFALMSLTLPIANPSYGIIRFAHVAGEDIDVSNGRVAMWLEVMPKILERPIFGGGIDQFQLQDWNSFRG
ncbi:hypothetical protein [Sphingorhabdus sp.]|uniref:hypothetical protein n=1 Tax=Sphingorhabdus sp. TaxID=1902408 RepID=UPI0032B87077